FARRNEPQREGAPDDAGLPGTNGPRSPYPHPAQAMLDEDRRDRRGRHGFQRVDDVAELAHSSSGRTGSRDSGRPPGGWNTTQSFGQCMSGPDANPIPETEGPCATPIAW